MVTLILAATVQAVCLTGYALHQRTGWTERGITPILGWKTTLSAAALLSITLGVALYPHWGTPAALSAAAFGWLGVIATSTDLATRKVPWDVAHPVAAIGLITFALSYTTEGALALGTGLIAMVAIPFIARALTNKGLGMSDVRLLWAATATCAWWAGQNWLIYALIGACALQLVLRLTAAPLHLGVMVAAPTNGTGTSAHRTPKMRRELPFAPALVLALYTAMAAATVSGYSACLMWNPTGLCR